MSTYSITQGTGTPAWRLPVLCGIVTSFAEAKRLLAAGGLYICNGDGWDRITEGRDLCTGDLIGGQYVLLRAGKRNIGAIVLNQ